MEPLGSVCDNRGLGIMVGRIREQLSKRGVRTQADCLITRMGNVGEGAGAAGKRRRNVIRWVKEMWPMWQRWCARGREGEEDLEEGPD